MNLESILSSIDYAEHGMSASDLFKRAHKRSRRAYTYIVSYRVFTTHARNTQLVRELLPNTSGPTRPDGRPDPMVYVPAIIDDHRMYTYIYTYMHYLDSLYLYRRYLSLLQSFQNHQNHRKGSGPSLRVKKAFSQSKEDTPSQLKGESGYLA